MKNAMTEYCKICEKELVWSDNAYGIILHMIEQHPESELLSKYEEKVGIEHSCYVCKERFIADISFSSQGEVKIQSTCGDCGEDHPLKYSLMKDVVRFSPKIVELLEVKPGVKA